MELMKNFKHPKVDNTLLDLENVYYELKHDQSYVNKNDPSIEGPHIHDSYEIYFNVSGDVSFLVSNQLYPVKHGDIVFLRPTTAHHCVYNKSSTVEHFVLWIKAQPNSCFADFLENNDLPTLLSFDINTKKNILNSLYKLYKISTTPTKNGQLLQTACLLQILSMLCTGENQFELNKPQSFLPTDFQNILNGLNKNFLQFHTVESVAEHFFTSPATLNRWFRKYLHLSPKEYLEAKKLSLAKKLLMQGKSVTEAGLLSGFFDASHFIAVFKKKFTKTPFEYKKELSHNKI